MKKPTVKFEDTHMTYAEKRELGQAIVFFVLGIMVAGAIFLCMPTATEGWLVPYYGVLPK